MAYLDGVKVGDKLWSIQLGECEVHKINQGSPYSISVKNGRDMGDYTLAGGYLNSDLLPSLFWSKPKIELPRKPKRIVKKAGWINIYPNDDTGGFIYQSRSEADNNSLQNRIACIKIEYEVEE